MAKTTIVSTLSSALLDRGSHIVSSGCSGSRGRLPWRVKAQIGYLAPWMYVVYAWTIGHGGRTRAATEYRIQLKLPGQLKAGL